MHIGHLGVVFHYLMPTNVNGFLWFVMNAADSGRALKRPFSTREDGVLLS